MFLTINIANPVGSRYFYTWFNKIDNIEMRDIRNIT